MKSSVRRAAPAYLRGESPKQIKPRTVANADGFEIHYRGWHERGLMQVVTVELFAQAPEFVLPCVTFLLERGRDRRPSTRSSYVKQLKYFSRFLMAYGSSYGLRITEYSEVSSQIMAAFLKWLRGEGDVVPRVNKTGGLSKLSAGPPYRIVRDLLIYVRESEEFSHLLRQNIVFSTNISNGGYLEVKHRSGLSEVELIRIRQACFTELKTIFEKLLLGRNILADERFLVSDPSSPGKVFKRVETCLKTYNQLEAQGIFYPDIRRAYRGLARAMRGSPYHRLTDLLQMLHFTKRSLVPAIVLLQMHLAFEPDTLINLNWSDESDSFLFGARRGVLKGTKYRGAVRTKAKTYTRQDKRDFSPAHIISMLRLVTPETAKRIGHCDRIFTYAREDGTFGFFKDSGRFQFVLTHFISEHKLPHFTLSSLRKTGADVIAKASGGDIAAQKAFLQHETASTTLQSYQSEVSIARREDDLAHSMNVRARRVKLKGKAETRGANLGKHQRLAATLGFYCIDAYDSPKRSQKKGELCGAYGECPTCPLAQVNKCSPQDYARLVQVREKLQSARRNVDPSRWKAKWEPELIALETVWLPSFPGAVVTASAALALPPIPDIE